MRNNPSRLRFNPDSACRSQPINSERPRAKHSNESSGLLASDADYHKRPLRGCKKFFGFSSIAARIVRFAQFREEYCHEGTQRTQSEKGRGMNGKGMGKAEWNSALRVSFPCRSFLCHGFVPRAECEKLELQQRFMSVRRPGGALSTLGCGRFCFTPALTAWPGLPKLFSRAVSHELIR